MSPTDILKMLIAECEHIHNKVLFDCINDSLLQFKPYGKDGEPQPWTRKNRRLKPTDDFSINEVFEIVKHDVSYFWQSGNHSAVVVPMGIHASGDFAEEGVCLQRDFWRRAFLWNSREKVDCSARTRNGWNRAQMAKLRIWIGLNQDRHRRHDLGGPCDRSDWHFRWISSPTRVWSTQS